MHDEVPDGQLYLDAGCGRVLNQRAPIVVVRTRARGEGAPNDAATAAVWAIGHLAHRLRGQLSDHLQPAPLAYFLLPTPAPWINSKRLGAIGMVDDHNCGRLAVVEPAPSGLVP